MSNLPAAGLRLFTAIDIPAENKAELAALMVRLQKGMQFTGAHPTWVASENLHITLSFLGSQDPGRIPAIQEAMTAAAEATPPFDLRFSGLELFPTPREPKVISMAIRGKVDELTSLANKLSEELQKHGFEAEKRPFRAHLTLARIKSVKGLAGLRSVVKSHEAQKGTDFAATAITLFESTLGSAAPTYTVLASSPFTASHSSAAAASAADPEQPPSADN